MTFDIPVRDDLRAAEPYGAPHPDVPVRLNVNENPYPVPEALRDAIASAVLGAAAGLNRYPDREAVELRGALLAYLRREAGVSAEVGVDQVWVANGSNEVMSHLLLAFGGPGRTALSFAPTYSMYPEYARESFTRYLALPRTEDFRIEPKAAIAAIDDLRPSLVLLAAPNNPTGTPLPAQDLDAILRAAAERNAIVVVDEAYSEFRSPGTPSACASIEAHPNLVVTRTMSKAFAMAGLRVGYCLAASPRIVDALRIVRLPYHLSALTQAAAVAALEHADLLQSQVAAIRCARDELALWLADRGLEVAASDANFLLFGRFPDRAATWQGLLDRGVLIRIAGPEGWLRVSIGTPEENDRFTGALAECLKEMR